MLSTRTLWIIVLLSLLLGFFRLNSERKGIDSEGHAGQKFSISKEIWINLNSIALFKRRCKNSESISEEECGTKLN